MPSCLFFYLFLSSDIIVFLLFEYYNILTMFVHFHFVDKKDIEAALSDKLFVYICDYHFWGSSCTNSEILLLMTTFLSHHFLHVEKYQNLFSSLQVLIPSFGFLILMSSSYVWVYVHIYTHFLHMFGFMYTYTHCHELFIYTHELKF